MRKTALIVFVLFFGVSFSTLALAQQKEKKVDSKTTKIDTSKKIICLPFIFVLPLVECYFTAIDLFSFSSAAFSSLNFPALITFVYPISSSFFWAMRALLPLSQ